ncbi:NACHT domain-containing protein [Methylobacter marinus]|uniref:ATP-binding protein n=1 Tax=Methylobacter marinus TaxID=34058 RepID=UPI0012EBFE18|nr:ATP-binding protein [Methylobacter marinus]
MAKRKAAMVLYSIEESLGRYILENESSVTCQASGFEDIKIQDVIEKTYLDEIFQLVIRATKDTTEEIAIKRLYQLAHDLNLFEIRNTIAHPNRPFLDVYWYRVAAIAADPVFETLGIREIRAVLYSAEKGIIEEPPEGWDKKYSWAIPNNLPVKFESDITGLIGRQKELTELKEKIASPRINTAAVIAPGGYGKTALVLDLLKEIVSTPDSTKWADAVCYITLKTETWENDGFVKLDAASEIKAVEQLIADHLGIIFDEYIDDIDQAIQEFSDKRIVLCIDNLETILRDNDLLFYSFVEKLPRDWKVIVTSRVIITNAYIYSLSELKEKSAIHLARLYNRNKGGDELPQEKYVKISKDCYFNPLAIKMTLDMYISGKEIPDSITAAKSNIAYFSFSNLIESLSKEALQVLELIFIESESSRKLICEILELTADEAASAINELSRTSLINRSSENDKESYEINGSIKDLLIINPKCLEIRANIQGKLNKQKAVSKEIDIQQKAYNIPEWHFQYIPAEADDGLKILMKEFAKLRFSKNTNKEKISSVYAKFKQSEEHYNSDYLFVRSYAKLLESMLLVAEAKKYYLKALSLNNDKFTRYFVARFLFDQADYDGSLEQYLKLVSEINLTEYEPKYKPFYDSIYQGYFLSHLFKGEYEPVLEYTKKWKEETVFRSLFGTFRASSYKRKIETFAHHDVASILDCLNSATKILDDVYRTDGYSQVSCTQGIKIIEEIVYFLNREVFYRNRESECVNLLNFCDKHLVDIVDAARNRSSEEIRLIANSLAGIPLSENPFSNKRHWRSLTSFSFKNAIEKTEIPSQYELVEVVRIANNPKGGRTNFLFAEDQNDQEYFVHFDTTENCDWNDWLQIQVGTKLAVIESIRVEGKSAKTVRKCYLVNS